MAILNVHHRTSYRYSQPVEFGEHRLMSRPRDSHDLRLIDTALSVIPDAVLPRLKSRLEYQKTPAGPAETLGSPADMYGPGAVRLALTTPGRKPAVQVAPPSVDR